METGPGQVPSVNKTKVGRWWVGGHSCQRGAFHLLSLLCVFFALLMTDGTQRNSPASSKEKLFGERILTLQVPRRPRSQGWNPRALDDLGLLRPWMRDGGLAPEIPEAGADDRAPKPQLLRLLHKLDPAVSRGLGWGSAFISFRFRQD